MSKKQTRYFKVIYDGDTHGRFSGTKPKQAANKAFTSILKMKAMKQEDVMCEINFAIKECTRGKNNKKKYSYTGQRIELETPRKIRIKGRDGGADKIITYKYDTKIYKNKNVVESSEEESEESSSEEGSSEEGSSEEGSSEEGSSEEGSSEEDSSEEGSSEKEDDD